MTTGVHPRTTARLALSLALLVAAPLCPTSLALDPRVPLRLSAFDVWRDELPQASVLAVVQTRDGYLWLATYEGLVRFNGVAFTVLNGKTNPELGSRGVTALCEDPSGALWVGTRGGGLVRHVGGRFETFTTASGLSGDYVNAIESSVDGSLWIGTDAGLSRFRDGRFERFGPAEGLTDANVMSLEESRDGTLWIGVFSGGVHWLRNGRISPCAGAEAVSGFSVAAIKESADGSVWLGTYGGGLQRYEAGRLTRIGRDAGFDANSVAALCEDSHGSLWIGTDGAGVFRYRDGAFSNLSTRDGLSQHYVRSLCEDREGSIWIGTNRGLNRLKDRKFISYTARQGLANENVRVVCEDGEGTVWVGTDGGGLNAVRPDGTVTVISAAQGLTTPFIRSLHVGSDGSLWVGTNGGGVFRGRGGRFAPFPLDPAFSTRADIYAIAEEANGTLWFASVGSGVAVAAPDGSKVAYTAGNGLPHNNVRALFVDRAGTVWIGTNGRGLCRYGGGTFTVFTTKDGLADDAVFSMHEDGDGDLWIGTSGGLTRLRDGRFASVRISEGLFDNEIFQILEDDAGHFWFSSNSGVFRALRRDLVDVAEGRAQTVECTAFGKADGLASNQCNGTSQPAGWRGRDGRLWFATVGGVSVIDPREIRRNLLPPQVVVSRAVADGRVLAAAEARDLSWGTEKFEFHYDGLSFLAPERVRFRYRLEGLDRDWIEAGTRRDAFYNNLPPGDYRFRVVACNDDGVWNEAGAIFEFHLPPPPWKTWWAYLLYTAAAVGLVFGAVRLRVRTAERRSRELEDLVAQRTTELVQSETRVREQAGELAAMVDRLQVSERGALEANRAKSVFLSNMSHELRTPLNAVLGFAQLMDRSPGLGDDDRNNLAIIHRSGEHLLGLINDVLSLSKIEAGKLSLLARPFDLRRLLHEVEQMIRVRAESKGIDLLFDVEGSLPAAVQGDEGKLRQVLLNLLGNAVKFTERGRVVLRARWDAEDGDAGRARFEVEDTGPGISGEELRELFEPFAQAESGRQAREGTGLGLAISRQIVRLMGGEIVAVSELGRGTTFSFDVAAPRAEGPDVSMGSRRVVGLDPSQSPCRVLVVDDVMESRLLLARLLGAVGFEVREAADGVDAVREWERWRPALVWMDMRMPVMDGLEATREIRRREGVRGPWPVASSAPRAVATGSTASGSDRTNPDHCRIVALTASAFEHDRAAILAAGCDGFVTKPFREETLFETMADLLGVRYRYEGDGSYPPEAERRMDVVTVERLSALPAAVVADLGRALHAGDTLAATAAAERIQALDPMLADAVARAVASFQFEELLTLLERLETGTGYAERDQP